MKRFYFIILLQMALIKAQNPLEKLQGEFNNAITIIEGILVSLYALAMLYYGVRALFDYIVDKKKSDAFQTFKGILVIGAVATLCFALYKAMKDGGLYM